MWSSFLRFFWKKYDGDLTQLSYDEYKRLFLELSLEQLKAAYEKAWDTRKFEIELYWKRAAYFWAFLVPTFAAYFAILNSNSYLLQDKSNHAELYLVISIGFIISVAWALVNRGSKSWQRHWEVVVDLLEDKITGPLYKTVNPTRTFSVSKINELSSWFISLVWLFLAYKYKIDQKMILGVQPLSSVNWIVSLSSLSIILTLMSMLRGHGRGYFSNRGFTMHKRNITYLNPDNSKVNL